MATAGLTEGVFDDHTTVSCAGAKSFYGRPFRCWKSGRARHGQRPHGDQALLRRLLLHPRPEAGDREDRPLRPPVRPRLAHRHRHPGREERPGARLGLEPEGPQAALVPRRDHLGLDRPGAGADDAAPDGRDDRPGGQRRLQRHAPPDQGRRPAAARARVPRPGRPARGARAACWAVVNEPGGTGLRLGPAPRGRHRRQERHRAGHRAGAAHRRPQTFPSSTATTPGSPPSPRPTIPSSW